MEKQSCVRWNPEKNNERFLMHDFRGFKMLIPLFLQDTTRMRNQSRQQTRHLSKLSNYDEMLVFIH